MNLYEQLGIESTVPQQDIKRAYFRMVRQFTPEKDPERFMRLREAYETLSDITKRANYDASLSRFSDLPEYVAPVIMQAEQLAKKKLWADAINLLEKSEYNWHGDVRCALCRLYVDIEKTGTAVKIAERLIAENPENTAYLRLAVEVYSARGWSKKAHDMQEYLECFEPANEDNSYELLFEETDLPPYVMGLTVEKIEGKGGKAPLLCAHILSNCFRFSRNKNGTIYEQLSFDQMDKPDDYKPWGDSLFVANKLLEHIGGISNDKRERLSVLIKKNILSEMFLEDQYALLPQVEQIIRNIGKEELFQTVEYEIISFGYTALEAVRAGIPKPVAALPLMHIFSNIDLLGDEYRAECKNEIIIMELDVLVGARRLAPSIERLQSEYSSFFRHAAEFFGMILQSSEQKIDNEIQRRAIRATRLNSRLSLSWLGEYDPFDGRRSPGARGEPVRVTKIGRNEPCPCGSGKKYKKCCGR